MPSTLYSHCIGRQKSCQCRSSPACPSYHSNRGPHNSRKVRCRQHLRPSNNFPKSLRSRSTRRSETVSILVPPRHRKPCDNSHQCQIACAHNSAQRCSSGSIKIPKGLLHSRQVVSKSACRAQRQQHKHQQRDYPVHLESDPLTLAVMLGDRFLRHRRLTWYLPFLLQRP